MHSLALVEDCIRLLDGSFSLQNIKNISWISFLENVHYSYNKTKKKQLARVKFLRLHFTFACLENEEDA